ncbi:MAG: hypothetical protein AAGC63_15380 [Propionicimonas sp.]
MLENDFFDGYKRPHKVDEALIRKADQLIADFTHHVPGSDTAIREAFTSSEFTAASTVALQRSFLQQLGSAPSPIRQYATIEEVPDFRDIEIVDYDHMSGDLPKVPELTEYPLMKAPDGSQITLRVGKYGARFAASFEAWRDRRAQGILRRMPGNLAAMATRTESSIGVAPLVNAAGINGTTFTGANAASTMPLTFDNAITARNTVQGRVTGDGEFVDNTGWILLIPPTLDATADAILAVSEYEETVGQKKFRRTSTLGNVTKVTDPALLRINKGANAAKTWFLVPKPNTGRPGLYLALLEGETVPELRVKTDGGQYVGGGAVAPEQGSFMIDDIQWRARHIVGSGSGNKLALFASDGSGS